MKKVYGSLYITRPVEDSKYEEFSFTFAGDDNEEITFGVSKHDLDKIRKAIKLLDDIDD